MPRLITLSRGPCSTTGELEVSLSPETHVNLLRAHWRSRGLFAEIVRETIRTRCRRRRSRGLRA